MRKIRRSLSCNMSSFSITSCMGDSGRLATVSQRSAGKSMRMNARPLPAEDFMKVSKFAAMAMAMATTALAALAEPTTLPNTQSLDLARQLNDAFIQVADHVSSCVVVIEVSEKESADAPT